MKTSLVVACIVMVVGTPCLCAQTVSTPLDVDDVLALLALKGIPTSTKSEFIARKCVAIDLDASGVHRRLVAGGADTAILSAIRSPCQSVWNSEDNAIVADSLSKDMLSSAWITRFKQSHGGRTPVLQVASIANQTTERVNTKPLLQNLTRALIMSGAVDVLASKEDEDRKVSPLIGERPHVA